jgi:hypothetical protein
MITRLALTLLLGCPLVMHAQQASTPVAEPQYMYQFAALNPDGSLITLESQKLTTEHDTHYRFVYVKGSSEQTVPGERSPVRLPSTATFVVKWVQGMDAIDPNTIVRLKPFVIQKGLRTLPLHSGKAVIFGGVKSQTTPDNSLPVTFKKYGQGSLLITPAAPLTPGEYELETNGGVTGVSCFGVDAGLTNSSSPAGGAATPATAKAEPPVWKLKPVQHPQATTDVYEATLAGTAEAGGKHGAAQIDISCTVNRFTSPASTDASASADLKIRREMVAFPTDGLTCQGDGAVGAPFLRSQLGTEQEQTRNLCFDGDLGSDPKAVLAFGLGYDEPVIATILQTSGEPLSLKIRPRDGGPDALTTTFQLAANGADVLAAFDPCLKIEEAARKKAADAIVVACPELPDKKLAAVDVLVGPALKKLTADPENDIGTAWNMPKPTKAHPTVPKLMLACSYQDQTSPGIGSAPTAKSVAASTAKKLLPIPATAKFCVFREDESTNAPYGHCSRE